MRSQNFKDKKEILYLIPTPIGNLKEFSPRAIQLLEECDLIACEDTRVTKKLLSFFNISKPCISLREHNEVEQSNKILEDFKAGRKICYLSDAGYPCISDPGAKLVSICLNNDINVSCISGPNAALNALVASGLPCDKFYFHGFLNAKESQRNKELEQLKTKEETIIFYESPHRIEKTINSIRKVCGNRRIVIARELTKLYEEFIRCSIDDLLDFDFETLKGELVLILEGNLNKNEIVIDDDYLLELINEYKKENISKKVIASKISTATGISKNYIYKLTLK